MKIQIIAPIGAKIRPTPSTKQEQIGSAAYMTILDTAGTKKGEMVDGVDSWYELTVGGYIWAGACVEYRRSAVIPYSQSNIPWRWNRLGYGTSWDQTIGNYGCALTCCSMLCDIDPGVLNSYLKRVNGYVNQTWLIWSALEKATSGKLIYKSGAGELFSPKKMSEVIKQEGACIVEVTGSGIPMHFVVAVGLGTIIDPLDGKYKQELFDGSRYKAISLRDIHRT